MWTTFGEGDSKQRIILNFLPIVERPNSLNALFEEFNVPTVHTATLYTIWKLTVCSLQIGMTWSVKMVPLLIN